MKMSKSVIVLFSCIAFIFGCSNETIQKNPIYNKSTEIKNLVNQTQWHKAKQEAKLILEYYRNGKWKYQLLGDETEYNNLNEQILKLQVSIEEKDKAEAKRNIALIEHYIEMLYFK
ncbi:DUF4363 family protein [Virgibacillus ndiopensis]|uniref:DUF4363 family protein n=1 Tax=Virgibacillus ndiopensis TaxID=2004408 RepID=UPI00159BD508|nr:DUF4363 family protein [Virgibacillus ndiopensis]